MQQYGLSLLNKLFTLNKSELMLFMQHQCNAVQDPLQWLNSLEQLLELNNELISSQEEFIQYSKIELVLGIKLQLVLERNKVPPEPTYDFDKVRLTLKNYTKPEEKISYLLEVKTHYLQNKPFNLVPGIVPFDEKVQLEIDLIRSQSALNISRQQVLNTVSEDSPRMKINCNLNQFVDIFYRLIYEEKICGKPFLESDNNTIAYLLSTFVLDKADNPISAETVKTILKPSRVEKRPKGYSKFTIKRY